jgi:hypothetical protein
VAVSIVQRDRDPLCVTRDPGCLDAGDVTVQGLSLEIRGDVGTTPAWVGAISKEVFS